MENPITDKPATSEQGGVTNMVRVQILTTEHYSLLATRGITWNEMFSRTTMLITVLSAATVGLALVAQATNFGPSFRLFALLVLPVVFLVGFVTFIRLGEANTDDIGLVIGMNRIRHAYLEMAPDLQPYFITGHYDDNAGILQSYGLGYRQSLSRYLGGTPALVGIINAAVFGVFAALISEALGATGAVDVVAGVAAAAAAAAGQGALMARAVKRGRGGYHPRFPSE